MSVSPRYRFSLPQLMGVVTLVAFLLAMLLPARYAFEDGDVHCVCISPNGRILATGSEDGTVRLWDTVSQQHRSLTGHRNIVRSLAFAPDGKTLASGSLDETVRLWDMTTGEERMTLRGHSCANAVSFSPDGRLLAVGDCFNNVVFVWNVDTQKIIATLVGHADSVNSVSFAPDGKSLASASEDGTVKLWDVGAWTQRTSIKAINSVTSIAFSPDGKTLAVATELEGVKLWSAVDGFELSTLRGSPERLTSVAFSPDGEVLATGSATDHIHMIYPGNIRFTRSRNTSFVGAKLWDVSTGVERASFPNPTTVWSVAFSADGSSLVAGTENWVTRVWDLRSGLEKLRLVARKPIPWVVWYLAIGLIAAWLVMRTLRIKRSRQG